MLMTPTSLMGGGGGGGGGYGDAVVTHSPPTSELGGLKPRPYVRKLVVAYRLSAVYSTEPLPTVCAGFLCP